MSRVLQVAERFSFIREAVSITDAAGDSLYEAKREFDWLSPTWRIHKRGLEVARIRRVVLAVPAAWAVQGDLGAFRVERDLYQGAGGYWVNGGPFDKAEVHGRILSGNLDIAHGGRNLATTQMPLLTWGGRFSVELDDDDRVELLTAIVMVTHHMDENPGGLLGLILR